MTGATAIFQRVFTHPDLDACVMNTFIRIALVLYASLLPATAYAVSEITIRAASIEHPQLEAKNASLRFNLIKPNSNLTIGAELKPEVDKDWTTLQIACTLTQASKPDAMDCGEGLIKNAAVNLPFSFEIQQLFNQGEFSLSKLNAKASLQLKNASFSDAAGLHAAEKLNGKVDIAIQRQGLSWAWQTKLDWQTGELFWQPFYVESAGHQLTAAGALTAGVLDVHRAHLTMRQVGALDVSGQLRLSDLKLIALNANLPNLNLSAAYPLLFKPFLGNTAFNNTAIAGYASLSLQIQNAELKSFDLRLKEVDVADIDQKFALYKLDAEIPWSYDKPEQVSVSYKSGSLLNLPLGKTNIRAEVNRFSLTSPNITLPILDGALNLSDISAARIGGEWYWHLRAQLQPISMADFSHQLNLPIMSGKASADIPLVTYSNGLLSTDGSMVLNIFEGTATVTQLTMRTPMGIAPKLNADIALRNLDLGDLTRTFSFGAIEGKLDGDIEDLELQNWKPVHFDASLYSSPGRYKKKISQRAVENISALGGGGAAAAVQRSFLRFFEQFNYGKMGLSCKLRNDICEMSGVESTPQGYVIVKGSGIPSITVMGYNRTVGWSELLARIKRVTDGNSKAVVK